MALILVTLGSAAEASDRPITGTGSGQERVDTITLERGEDLGQNLGTLFEVRSAEGHALLGAGFLGAYSTFDRVDRHVLHVFERNEALPTFETLPPPFRGRLGRGFRTPSGV